MKLGIFAKTFTGTEPAVVFSAAQTAGFSVVQYNMACSGLASMPDEIENAIVADVREAAENHCIGIAALSATYNMIHPNLDERKLGLKRLEVLAARSSAIGTKTLTLCTGTRHATDQWHWHSDNDSTEAWRDLCVEMHAALKIAELYDLTLGIEPELANVVSSAAKAKHLIDDMKSPRLKIVFDAANLFEAVALDVQKTIISKSVDVLAEHIVLAHAKDRLPDGTFTAAGQGCLDYGYYLSCLKRAGFDGALVTHGLSAMEAPQVAKFLNSYI